VVGLENLSRDLRFENCLGELGPFEFAIVLWTQGRLQNSYKEDFSSIGWSWYAVYEAVCW